MPESKSNGHGLALELVANPFVEPPAVQQFNGAEILNRVSEFIRRYVHLSDQQARIVTVWTAHTHAAGAATTTPYLNINSAVKQSGKTRLLEVLVLLVNRPWYTGRTSAACLARKVDQVHPTLLLDETDAAFQGEKDYSEALRGILNSGFQEGGATSLVVGVGASMTFRDFKTFCPKALAGIGNNLPDTVADRSIPIRLERKLRSETVCKFRRRKVKGEAGDIKGELSNWISSIADRLKEAEPSLPDELSDRQEDGMEPLLAIADEAGGDWPEAIRKAAVAIFWSQAAEDQNIGVQLLVDIRLIFGTLGDDKVSSANLIDKLKEIETSPWADWSKGKGLTANGLSRLLKPFGISPRNIRVEGNVPKGYLRESFADAWERYLPRVAPRSDLQTATPLQPACSLIENDFSNRYTKADVADRKSGSKPHEHCIVAAVAVAKSPNGGGNGKTPELTLPCHLHGVHSDWRIRILPDGGEPICGKCQPEPAAESPWLFGDMGPGPEYPN